MVELVEEGRMMMMKLEYFNGMIKINMVLIIMIKRYSDNLIKYL
jgi:hypothetical protein